MMGISVHFMKRATIIELEKQFSLQLQFYHKPLIQILRLKDCLKAQSDIIAAATY